LRPSRPPGAKPFLKWAGGKGLVIPQLRRFVPDLVDIRRYFEPFLGGGAVFFALRPPQARLGDLNEGLVLTYKVVKEEVRPLITSLHKMRPPSREREYYDVRDAFNELSKRVGDLTGTEAIDFAAKFIWLNHTCYNGLYRVNRSGGFNVPYGFYQHPSIYTALGLEAASHALRAARATIAATDYETVLADAGEGDLAYLDPPYDPVSETASFTGYTAEGFSREEQERLSRVVHKVVEQGCRVILSNSPSDLIRGLYRDFRTETVSVPRAINCVGSKRTRVDELVVIAS
jgi:DNA adenine methylase